MAATAKTFRVFVSSTFSDLKAERNALQERVFPRLRELAAKHRCRFQAIDLRWGVSEEASLDQQAMNICLGEIARCQQVTPRPNFIVLLGDRYGWCPPPSQVPADEFDKIHGAIDNDEDQALLKKWYSLDENAVPSEYRLNPRQRGGMHEKYDDWQPVESRLQEILAQAVKGMGFDEQLRLPYTASATEQEIVDGALRVKEASEHVLCFFRSIDGLPQQFNAQSFQTTLAARLDQEYEKEIFNQPIKDLIKTLIEMGPGSSAKDFADPIKRALEQAPKATTEGDVVNFILQALVDFTAKDFLNLDETEWTIDTEAHDNQKELKGRLEAYVPDDNVRPYKAQWTGDGITTNHIDQLCEDVYNSLSHIILDEVEHPHEIVPAEKQVIHIQPDEALDDEGLANHKFAEERLRFFVGRTTILKKIDEYTRSSGRRALAIVGGGGTGKSALVARAIQQTQESYPKAEIEIVYRFIGATPGSSDGRSLLDSLCREISRRYGADETDIPMDYRELVPELAKRMQLATVDKPLILFLDSLDQLSPSQGARSLTWLPDELPEHVSVIASTREEDTFEKLKAKQPREEVLGGLSREEGDQLLSEWLADARPRRTLQAPQREEVLDKFEQGKKVLDEFERLHGKDALDRFEQSPGNPLYLKLAFEEARLWTSASDQPPEQLALGVSGIIEQNMIDRLKNEGNHGEMLVSHALGYLAVSRDGLAEDELVDLLSRDLEVYRWFMEGSHHLPSDLIRSAIEYCSSQGKQDGKEEVAPGSDEESTAHVWLSDLIRSAIDYRKWQEKQDDEGAGGTGKDDERAALAWLKEKRNPPEQVADFLSEVLPKADAPRLPIVLWSRLSFDLAPYLTERMVDGSPLMTFYHRELGDVSKEAFLEGGKELTFHEKLAAYFRFKADPKGDKSWAGSSDPDGDGSWTGSYPHGLSELPYHLTRAARYEEVYQTLTDFAFLEHKTAEVGVLERKDEKGNPVKTYTGVLRLQDDFEGALKAMPGEGKSGTGDRSVLIVTAVDSGAGLSVYCPVCNKRSVIARETLGEVITCPQEGCNAKLKLNPFTIKMD